MRALAAAALVPLSALAIAACGGGDGTATAPVPHRQTASQPGTEVRIACAQGACECDQVSVIGVLAGFHP